MLSTEEFQGRPLKKPGVKWSEGGPGGNSMAKGKKNIGNSGRGNSKGRRIVIGAWSPAALIEKKKKYSS